MCVVWTACAACHAAQARAAGRPSLLRFNSLDSLESSQSSTGNDRRMSKPKILSPPPPPGSQDTEAAQTPLLEGTLAALHTTPSASQSEQAAPPSSSFAGNIAKCNAKAVAGVWFSSTRC